jgi:hypothetical protein
MDEAEKWLDLYLSTNVNSSLKLQQLPRSSLIKLAEEAGRLPGDRKAQFERLLMESPILSNDI